MSEWPYGPEDCGMCGERLDDGLGTGVLFLLGGVPSGKAHQECMLRSTLGGIGHHKDHAHWCLEQHDPDGGRTFRQSALEVYAMLEEKGVEAMLP